MGIIILTPPPSKVPVPLVKKSFLIFKQPTRQLSGCQRQCIALWGNFFIHQILLFNQDARDVKVYWRDKVSFIWCSAQLIFIQYSLKLRIIWNSSQFIFACDRTSTSHAPFWPFSDFFFLRNIFCLCVSHNACAKLFVVFVEHITKIRFESRVMIFLVVDQHGEKLQKYLTSKRQGQEWDWLQKMQRWSKQTTTLFSSKASFDLHSHHAGNKYLDSHNNRQAGPGVGIVSAKWNTKQS